MLFGVVNFVTTKITNFPGSCQQTIDVQHPNVRARLLSVAAFCFEGLDAQVRDADGSLDNFSFLKLIKRNKVLVSSVRSIDFQKNVPLQPPGRRFYSRA